ncbi:MAG: hypothetical protein FWC49_05440, partial [Proteobacteria bacterium]|nr:hypothetical protein [Pseudomonadota bacterium]
LPVSLQPSLDQGEVLYLSARRSTGGDGMGQCGAGVEKHLNVLRINEKRPQVVARLLITSCWRGIELAGLDGQDPDPLSAFSIVNGRLRIQFINYEGQGSVTAELSDDRRHLLIIPEEKPTLE